MKKILFKILFVISVFISSSSTANPDCSLCWDSEDYVATNFGGDQQACLDDCSGIPINDYSYLLVIIGGASALFMVYYKNKRNIEL